VGQRSIPGFCERCGQRFEIEQPEPGERELGLDRIKTAFRHCSTCRQYVGRTCCWNPDAVACAVCAPSNALSTTVEAESVPAATWTLDRARESLAELAASVEAVEHVGSFLGPEPGPENGELERRAWDDAWWATGWLIARAETSRDAAAKALWHVAAEPDTAASDELTGELVALLEEYRGVRSVMEERLATAAGRITGRPAPVPMVERARRLRPALVGAGAIAAVVVLALGAAALTGAGLPGPGSSGGVAATDGNGGILGGAGGPGGSRAPAATPVAVVTPEPTPLPTQPPPPAVLASVSFDELRIGMLEGATDRIGPVTGRPEVVAFPTPFDRSVRLAGSQPQRFCVPLEPLDADAISVAVDLYSDESLRSGRLELSMSPSGADPSTANVPLELLGGMAAGEWHLLVVAWAPGEQANVAIGDPAREEVRTLSLPLAANPVGADGAVCVTTAGMASGAELLLDNLRVEQ
jgi:hypothetical protein